jgi:hypothetical protein
MGGAGETWSCPHCGERILRSSASCPACQRRLRFDALTPPRSGQATACPLSIDGVIRHPGSEAPWEYSVLVQVHDAEGQLLARRVVGVGAIQPGEARRFTLRVEMYVAEKSGQAAVTSRPPAAEKGKSEKRLASSPAEDPLR